MSFAGYVYFIVPSLQASNLNVHDATGIFLLGWTIFTVYMTVGAFRVSRAVFAVFLFLSITFLLLTIGALAYVFIIHFRSNTQLEQILTSFLLLGPIRQ